MRIPQYERRQRARRSASRTGAVVVGVANADALGECNRSKSREKLALDEE